jgi:hypothetical protein
VSKTLRNTLTAWRCRRFREREKMLGFRHLECNRGSKPEYDRRNASNIPSGILAQHKVPDSKDRDEAIFNVFVGGVVRHSGLGDGFRAAGAEPAPQGRRRPGRPPLESAGHKARRPRRFLPQGELRLTPPTFGPYIPNVVSLSTKPAISRHFSPAEMRTTAEHVANKSP